MAGRRDVPAPPGSGPPGAAATCAGSTTDQSANEAVLAAALFRKGLQLLAQRERSPSELRQRLLVHAGRWLHPAPSPPLGRRTGGESVAQAGEGWADPIDPVEARGIVERLLDSMLGDLSARGFLSAERYVEVRVRSLQRRHGNRRILHDLRSQDLVPDGAALAALQASEPERALVALRRRFAEVGGSAAERAKAERFLLSRGFSSAAVRQALKAAQDPDGDPA